MKTFLAATLSFLVVAAPALAQHPGGGRDRQRGGQPNGGQPNNGGGRNHGGGFPRNENPRRDFPHREQPRGEFPQRDAQRENQQRENQRRENQQRENQRRDNERRQNERREQERRQKPPVVIIPPHNGNNGDRNRDRDNDRRGGRWDGGRREDRKPPVVIVPPQNGGNGRQDRQRGRVGAPQQRPDVKPPTLHDPLAGRRFGSIAKPSWRDRDENEQMHRRVPRQWPNASGAPQGYTRWDRAPRRTDFSLTLGHAGIIAGIHERHRHESRRGGYWWHQEGNVRYSHHCDDYGYHWYGWYIGSSYYWTRWHNGYWWWYDSYRHRWVYRYDNRWWWQDPVNVTYIYIYQDDADTYYRYDDRVDRVVLQPETPANGAQTSSDVQTVYSTDGSRMVQIVGAEKNAYLHDTAEKPEFDPVWLGKNVTEARFKYVDGGDGDVSVTHVLILKADGTFDVFDGEGYAQQPEPPKENESLDSLKTLENPKE